MTATLLNGALPGDTFVNAAGEPVPAKTAALMTRPILPLQAYKLIGDLGWLMQARRNRALTRLRARPFGRA